MEYLLIYLLKRVLLLSFLLVTTLLYYYNLILFNYVFFFSPSFILRCCGIKCIVVLLYFSLQIFNTCPYQASYLIEFKN